MARLVLRLFVLACAVLTRAAEDLGDFDFESDADEVMIAQESRHYHSIQPQVRIVKPTGVINSHRPQYNLDSFENGDIEDLLEANSKRSLVKNYKSSSKLRAKETMAKDAVQRAIERKDHAGKFAQILPIIRAMSPTQRQALASLVANQVTTPPGRAPLTLGQVRSMFSNTDNTTEQMLPILLDMANLVRRATGPGKATRDVSHHPQLIRRSIEDIDSEPFELGVLPAQNQVVHKPNIRKFPQRNTLADNNTETHKHNVSVNNTTKLSNATEGSPFLRPKFGNISRSMDTSLDLMADSTNATLAQDLPVAEKLRALNRYIDRKGIIRRGTYPPKPYPTSTRRTMAESTVAPVTRRRPTPPRKLPVNADQSKCELFTNTLCLHAEDYPTDAIVQSIRRNKAAAGALLADFKDPGDGAVDGVTADQESKYTADHYLVSNRRGDTANRDFASAGEAGFMCPSTVKYARPQRARATSGQWKYIVNTGEHTQTLRLEKCLKPKESCTYLTDNFKSKCVQVYNYHRLLTWDQQNGLHMDIFKVPTCCSCHIEGYSVSFPPVGHRIHETSSEHFPGEDLSSEQGNHAFEAVQSTIQRPISKAPPFSLKKPESFPPFADNSQNLIAGIPFTKGKLNDNEDPDSQLNPNESYSNSYFPDSFNQPTNSLRNVRRPPSGRSPAPNSDPVTLPSYLEPPTPSASNTFSFNNEPPSMPPKFKTGTQFKRGFRPNRRPIRKKISGPEDLMPAGSAAIDTLAANNNFDTVEDLSDFIDEPQIGQASSINNKPREPLGPIGPNLKAIEEKTSTVKPSSPQQQKVPTVDNFTSNGKRINYNYHPIIDFFGEDEREGENESIDREDIMPSFVPSIENEWKPMSQPSTRNTHSSKIVSRTKQ